jgi:hypothetical protein
VAILGGVYLMEEWKMKDNNLDLFQWVAIQQLMMKRGDTGWLMAKLDLLVSFLDDNNTKEAHKIVDLLNEQAFK